MTTTTTTTNTKSGQMNRRGGMIKKYPIAVCPGIVSMPGQKPDFGSGIPKENLTDWQKRTRSELTYKFENFELTSDWIVKAVSDRGYTITTWHNPPRKTDNFIKAQHLGADFDNLQSVREVLDHPLIKNYGAIIYHTPSSRPSKPKMRAIFLLEKAIEDKDYYGQAVRAFHYKLTGLEADRACTDPCRLFYGNQGCELWHNYVELPMSVLEEWVAEYERDHPVIERAATVFAPATALQEKRRKAFARVVLTRAGDRIRTAIAGTRHETLKASACNVFHYVNGRVIDQYEAENELEQAALAIGLPKEEITAILKWASQHATAQSLPEQTQEQKCNRSLKFWAKKGTSNYAI